MKIEDLSEIINNRAQTRKKNSYTNKLLKLGPKKNSSKIWRRIFWIDYRFFKRIKKKNNRRSSWCNLSPSHFIKVKKNYY